MIWLIQDFDLLSILLRAFTLSFEALAVGGVFFLLTVATSTTAEKSAWRAASRFCSSAALALAVTQILSAAESAITLMAGSGISFGEVATADFFLADVAILIAALLLFFSLRAHSGILRSLAPLFALVILAASVALSHAASRLDHRALLVALTAAHHLGTATWIGAMPCLLIVMRHTQDAGRLHALVRRFSTSAIAGVSLLVAAGIAMSVFYAGSWNALYGTSYGLMVMAKAYLFALTVTLGAGNYFLLRRSREQAVPLLMRLRRFSEVEIGLGFTAVLIAASLTSQPPAADVSAANRLSGHEIIERLKWKKPLLATPRFAQLSKRAALKDQIAENSFTGGSANDAMDQAWSEYNHHWAGIVVLAAGVFACCAALMRRRWPNNWFRNWPLLFIGLAVFILLRADADAWPLGPRPFWQSFAESEVLEHRFFALLITAFAFFEWAVETGRLRSRRAVFIFPVLCALGGALLMTHTHSLGAMKDETLAEISHSAIALLGVTAGWSRWLELRLPAQEKSKTATALRWVWPVCLAMVGLVLLDYRES